MSFRTEKWITRTMVRCAPKTLFAFGDNMTGRGHGGQARAIRGEPNAVGIPTKWTPTMDEGAFFTDADLDKVRLEIDRRFAILANQLVNGGDVVWPADGIGTGRAQLKERAPQIWMLIEDRRLRLVTIGSIEE